MKKILLIFGLILTLALVVACTKKVTVEFDTNGAAAKASITLTQGEKLTAEQLHIARDGYTFIKWYEDSELTIEFKIENKIERNLKLYAKWEAIVPLQQFEITFVVNEETIKTLSVEENTLIAANDIPQLSVYDDSDNGFYYSFSEEDLAMLAKPIQEDLNIIAIKNISEYTVIFLDTKNAPIDTKKVSHGQAVELPELPAASAGTSIYWDHAPELLGSVTKNLEVRAKESVNSQKEVMLVEDGKVVMTIQKEGGNDQVLTEEHIKWELSKPGYRFIGWFDNYEGNGEPLTIAEFTFTNLITDLPYSFVYSKFVKLPLFSAPTHIKIEKINNELVFSWNQEKTNGIYPSDFILLAGEKELFLYLEVKDGVVTYNPFQDSVNIEANQVLKEWIQAGNYKLKIKAVPNVSTANDFYDSKYSSEYLYVEFNTEVPGTTQQGDYYILETFEEGRQRFIFITNQNYNFDGTNTVVAVTKGQELFNINSTKSVSTKSLGGVFELVITREGVPTTYEGLLIPDIYHFEFGEAYDSYLAEIGDVIENKTLLDKNSNADFEVGYHNEFYFDLTIRGKDSRRIDLNATILTHIVELDGNKIEPGQYYSLVGNTGLQFTNKASDKTFEVSVFPKYQTKKTTVENRTFTIKVTEAYNAYESLEMKNLFKNFNVKKINIQRGFEVKLAESDYQTAGVPYNSYGEERGNAYSRFANDKANDQIIINGNYQTLNGKKLPYATKPYLDISVIPAVNVQIGIFNYFVYDGDAGLQVNNHIIFSNLGIIGSTSTPVMDLGNEVTESETEQLTRTSGGHIGIVVRTGKAELTNVSIRSANIGVTNNASGNYQDESQRQYMELDFVYIDDSWSNSVYLHAADGVIIKNSFIGMSGGASIHVVDTNKESDILGSAGNDPMIRVHNTTQIENWINGDEAWFRVYGMQAAATAIKTNIENSIKQTGRSVIKKFKNPITGIDNEKINLIILSEPSESAQDNENNPTTGSQYNLQFEDENGVWNISHRKYDIFKSGEDPRAGGGIFATAIGMYSKTTDFMTLLATLAGAGLPIPPAEVGNLAFLLGMYNVSVPRLAELFTSAAGDMGMLIQLMKLEPNLPKYFEVYTVVPGFGPSKSPSQTGLVIELV